MNYIRFTYKTLFLLAVALIPLMGKAQILFSQECFTGGVAISGVDIVSGSQSGFAPLIGLSEEDNVERIFVFSYRYGNPDPVTIQINGAPLELDNSNLVTPVLNDTTGEYYSCGVIDATNVVSINSEALNISFPNQPIIDDNLNGGWWSVYLVVFFTNSEIENEVCNSIFLSDNRQDSSQILSFTKPPFDLQYPVSFSIYSSALTNFEIDRAEIRLNSELVGYIWSSDLIDPSPGTGVQGHCIYRNSSVEGINGDTANTIVERHDGLFIANQYLNDDNFQELAFLQNQNTGIRRNLLPGFVLTYTPSCEVSQEEMLRQYNHCRGDSVQLIALSGYDTYTWSKEEGLSDSTIANPWCSADSSGWYILSMKSDDGGLCPQTIPVFIEVNEIPEPRELDIRASSCPDNTGQIRAIGPAGKSPFSYWLDDVNQGGNVSDGLAPGVYDYRIRSAAGCEWDTTVALPLDPFQEASFDAFPASGYSPLDVFFTNTSTQATGYQWLIDGVPVSESEDITYTFPDSGSFMVSLIAYRLEESCADTATFTLRVEPGIRVLMPNIITPNGDGRNDALVAQVSGLASARWTIFNRWGNEVASGAEAAPPESLALWTPESDLPDGQYTVVLVAAGLDGKVERFVFEVAILR